MKKIILLITLAFGMIAGYANNLVISNVTKNGTQLSFDVSWDNAWNDGTFNDAVYIFIKYTSSGSPWQHLTLGTDPTIFTLSGDLSIVNTNNTGIMIQKSSYGTGTTNGSVTINVSGLINLPFPDYKVFGIEMVKVNQGAFYVGDGVSQERYYQGNDGTKPYYVQSENAITVGNTANDINSTWLYAASIPSNVPKGFNEFYMMKYEITQEQYVEFLNTLTFDQQQTRTQTDLSQITTPTYVMSNTTTVSNRNGIKSDGNSTANQPHTFYCDLNNNNTPNEATDGQNIACNYLMIKDLFAYFDWAGMRPMNALEYEKACRGTNYPIPNERANGTNLVPTGVTGLNNPGANNEVPSNTAGAGGFANIDVGTPVRVGCFATATTNRVQSGATFYGAMNMLGNVVEFVYFAGYNDTYIITNILGDGVLDSNGDSTLWTSNNPSQTRFSEKGEHYTGNLDNFTISDNRFFYSLSLNNTRNRQQGGRGVISFW